VSKPGLSGLTLRLASLLWLGSLPRRLSLLPSTAPPHRRRYRGQIIKELSKKVSLIQNEGLDEHRVRDLNDQINKLIREKGHWERQIKKLGGADHFRTAPQLFGEEDAEEVVPGRGYRYFGAAKKLPGVRELFKKKAPEREKRTRFEMMKGIDADYYG
jgi:pre-mRNA-splicing factor ISY1